MAVFRVEKNSGYTVMSNHHLRNRALSLKAKGLLSQMLSLPEDWDYTLQGLARINRESIDAIRQAIRELEQAGYIQRSRERDEKGRLRGADYVIFELPQPIPASVSPTLENPTLENPTQENPKTLNEDNRYKWNKATLTHILTRQEYCGDVVNFKTTKHFRDKRNHYVDRSQWHITENVHEPIIDRIDFENVQRILENAPVKRPNGDGEIHPLSGLLFCKDCGAKMHIRIDYRNGGKRHVAYCSEYHKGKAKNPKCSSPQIMDADLLMPRR